MKKILITGSSGFVGSWLVDEALKRGLDVYAGVRSSSSKVYLQDDRITFFEIDFTNPDSYKHALTQERFSYIIHNAGVVRALRKETFHTVNTEYTRSFLDTVAKAVPELESFTYMSSLAACGSADVAGVEAISPAMKPFPPTHYGRSKLKAEQIVKDSGIPYFIFRPTAVYGPRDQDILKLFKGVKMGVAPLIGRKDSILSFIYVKDLARVVLDAIFSTHINKLYVVSDGTDYKNNQFHKAVAETMAKKPIYPKIPMPVVTLLGRLSEIKAKIRGKADTFNLDKVNELRARNWRCDITELKKDFNFAADLSLSETLKETLDWYRRHGWI